MDEDNKDERIESLKERVSHLSRMLVKSFSYVDQDPDTFLQNARRSTEAICRFIYTKEIGEPKREMMLNDYGRELQQKKIIPDRIGILVGTIQTYGNYASHAHEDLSESTREWIAPCQTALASLTNWFFLEYLRGNVPNELITTVKNYSDAADEPAKTTKKEKSISRFKLLLALAAIIIVAVLYFYLRPVTSTNGSSITARGETDSLLKQKEREINELNAALPNPDAKRIAIIYFDTGGDNADLFSLRKGLADMLISDLSKVKMLNVVERARLEEILKEQKLSNSREFDPETAAKVGKLLGVQYILTGAFFEFMGSLRIDARIIEVETGKIIKSEGVNGVTSKFFDLEKELVIKIAKQLNVDLGESATGATGSLSYDASILYSKGLDFMDKGETEKAIATMKKVLDAAPDFSPAKKIIENLSPKI